MTYAVMIQTWTRLEGCRQSAAGAAAKVHPLPGPIDNKLTSQSTGDNTGTGTKNRTHLMHYYAAFLPRRGPHNASHSVCPSVCLSVCPSVPLSLPSVTSFRQPLASRMYFSARTEGIRTFRHALRAAYRTAISAAQILVIIYFTLVVRNDHRAPFSRYLHVFTNALSGRK